jgi:hypothetical protein
MSTLAYAPERRSTHAYSPSRDAASSPSGPSGKDQLRQSLRTMDYAAQRAALSPNGAVQMNRGPAPMGPSVEQIVQDAYTLGGQSRYQVGPEEAIRWVEERIRTARPEHKHVFIEAMKRINRRL